MEPLKLTAKTDRRRNLPDLHADDPRVSVPLYTIAEAAQYVGLPYSTLQSWINPGGDRDPLVTSLARTGYEASIPFIGLAEAFVLHAARAAGVPRHRIRPGVQAVKDELGIEHSLASQLLHTDGAELLVRYAAEDEDLEVARTRQRQLTETVKHQLQLITYAGDGYAARLHLSVYGPADVVVDPAVAFGYPVVKGKGTRVKDVLERFWAGEGLRAIDYDFDLNEEAVEALLRAQRRGQPAEPTTEFFLDRSLAVILMKDDRIRRKPREQQAILESGSRAFPNANLRSPARRALRREPVGFANSISLQNPEDRRGRPNLRTLRPPVHVLGGLCVAGLDPEERPVETRIGLLPEQLAVEIDADP